jgi:PGF-CTERM protein
VEVRDVTPGSIDGKTTSKPMWHVDADTVHVSSVRMPVGEVASGSGHLAEVSFKVIGEEGDKSVLDLSNGKLSDTRAMEFSIEEEFKDELNDEEISEELKEILKGNGCPLENPTVKVIKKDEKWKIIDRRVYLVMVKDNELKIRDTGEILAKWVDAEIKVGQEEEEEEEGEEPTPTPTLAPGVTPTPETNVTVTPSPTPTLAPGVTPSPTLAPGVTPTPKPAATTSPEAKPKSTPTPTPKPAVPGFEAIFAIVGILSIAYILQRRR